MTNSKGWSLLEVLIGVTVAAVAGGLIISLMVSSSKLFVDQSAKINHGLSLNQAKLEISELIEGASAVANQYPPEGTPQYTTGTDIVVIKLPSLTENGEIIDSVFDYGVISADSGNTAVLRKQIFKDNQSFRKEENKVLSTSLNDINFSYLDSGNNPTTPAQSARVSFEIVLSTKSGFSENLNKGSGTINLKNF